MVMEGEEPKNHLHVLEAPRGFAIETSPGGVLVELSEYTNQFAVVECDSDFLGLKIHAAGVEPFKDHVDATLILGWLVLPNHGRMDDAVIQSTAVIYVEIPISLTHKAVLHAIQPVLLTMNHTCIERLEGVQALMSVEDQQATGWLPYQEDAGHR